MSAVDVFWRCCGAFGVLVLLGFAVYWGTLVTTWLDTKWRKG